MSSIDHLPTQSLRLLYIADHKTEAASAAKLKKGELRKEIQNAITATSVKVLLEILTVEQLQTAAEPLHLETKDKKPKPVRSRNVLTKRLTEAILADGLSTYLDQIDTDALKGFAERIGLEPTSKATKGQIIEEIIEDVETNGVRLFFESFSEDLLRDVAYDMKLQKDPLALPGKTALIEAIVTNTDLPKKEKKKKASQPKVSKHKPALEKGVEYHDVFQHYYLEELVEYAKKNGLKVSGTKKDLINRIIAWLEGDKENTLAGTKKAPKRRKRAASKKKPAAKKSEDEVEAAPAEEEALEEGLDLDNLKKYSIAELKKYCTEEALSVKGTKKQDYIDAINAYNKE